MIIGHLPAGYLVAKGMAIRFPSRTLFLGLVVGAVIPDLDMLWFFFVDQGSTHHHNYLTHRPVVWLLVLLAGLAVKHLAIIGLGLGGSLHMILDTVLGSIAWAWPLSDATVTLIQVPATHSHWVLSFMAHWTFLIELVLVLLAAVVCWRSNKKRVHRPENKT